MTMTGIYNVLEKVRNGTPLTDKEKKIHEYGLTSVRAQIHDDIDRLVAEAYGWPADLAEGEILERLVQLNAERTAEEARGTVRWLRPEFQSPSDAASQTEMDVRDESPAKPKPKAAVAKMPWPKTLPEQVSGVRAVLAEAGGPVTAEAVARRFVRARTDKVVPILETLVTIGQVRVTADGRFVLVS